MTSTTAPVSSPSGWPSREPTPSTARSPTTASCARGPRSSGARTGSPSWPRRATGSVRGWTSPAASTRSARLAVPTLADWCAIELLDLDRPLLAIAALDGAAGPRSPSRRDRPAQPRSLAGPRVVDAGPRSCRSRRAGRSGSRIREPAPCSRELGTTSLLVAPILRSRPARRSARSSWAQPGRTASRPTTWRSCATWPDGSARRPERPEPVRRGRPVQGDRRRHRRRGVHVRPAEPPPDVREPGRRPTWSGAAGRPGRLERPPAPAGRRRRAVSSAPSRRPPRRRRAHRRPSPGCSPAATAARSRSRRSSRRSRCRTARRTAILTARDVSERIDVQARLTRIAGDERRQAAELRAVIQAMGEGMLVVDAVARSRWPTTPPEILGELPTSPAGSPPSSGWSRSISRRPAMRG